jgi:hypothetical protein
MRLSAPVRLPHGSSSEGKPGQCHAMSLTALSQVPSIGELGPNCLGLVGLAPSAVALAVFVFRYAFRPLWRRRPAWLRGFAKETDFANVNGLGPVVLEKATWTNWTVALLALSLLGAVDGFVGHLLSHEFLDAIPIVSFVSANILQGTNYTIMLTSF